LGVNGNRTSQESATNDPALQRAAAPESSRDELSERILIAQQGAGNRGVAGYLARAGRPRPATRLAVQRTPMTQPLVNQPPGAPASVSFNPLLKFIVDGATTVVDPGPAPGAPNWTYAWEVPAGAEHVEIHAIMYGWTSQPGSGFGGFSRVTFRVAPDGEIKDVSTFPIPLPATGMNGATATLSGGDAVARTHDLSIRVNETVDASTARSDTHGVSSSSSQSDTHTSGTTDSRSTTIGGGGEGDVKGVKVNVQGEHTEGHEDQQSDSHTQGSEHGSQASHTTTGPGTQNAVPSSLVVQVHSPQRDAPREYSVAGFPVAHSELSGAQLHGLQQFLQNPASSPTGSPLLYRALMRGQARIRLLGYASATGTDDYNNHLAAARCRTVHRYLAQVLNIPATAFEPDEVYGKALIDESTLDRRHMEDEEWRRVDVQVTLRDTGG
jgi:outer membrane protein OmpA-like peptidoglycan-associated protein